MKELDLKLEGYLERRWAVAPEPEREAFRQLLEAPDPEIWLWLLGRETPADSETAALIRRLQQV
jgi:antitoxin CptB